jgi:hypothetical protein
MTRSEIPYSSVSSDAQEEGAGPGGKRVMNRDQEQSSLEPQAKKRLNQNLNESIHDSILNLTKELMSKQPVRKVGEKENMLMNTTITVELGGPDKPDLTLIDLPGIFKAAMAKQCERDIVTARELSEHYISQSRTLILAVVKGGELQTNDIIAMTKKVDPDFKRTVLVSFEDGYILHGVTQKIGYYDAGFDGPRHGSRNAGPSGKDGCSVSLDSLSIEARTRGGH